MAGKPSETEAITAYLKPLEADDRVASYLTAALRDAQTAFDTGHAFWLATLGYLVAVEQIGHTVALQGTSRPGRRQQSREAFVAAIADFGQPAVSEEEANVLYDLRCALAHEFGLRKGPRGKYGPRLFILNQGGPRVRLPRKEWDHTRAGAARLDMNTVVNVRAVRSYVEDLVAHLRDLHHTHQQVDLVSGVHPEEVVGLLALRI